MCDCSKLSEPRENAPSIAVVDDDTSFLRSVGRLLRSAGYPVETFGSGREFLDSLATHRPACLVLDMHMPEMSGLELHQRLLVSGSSLPVVFVTAHETEATAQRMRQTGTELLLKPFDKDSLLAAIHDAMDRESRNG